MGSDSPIQSNEISQRTTRCDLRESARSFLNESSPMDQEKIELLTRKRGIEFATAVLYQHFCNRLPSGLLSNSNGPLLDKFEEPLDATLVIVTGALHEKRPDVGSDGRMLREVAKKNGWAVEKIPTNGVGRVCENAHTIRDWIDTRSTKRLILVSLSKGTTDAVAALFENDCRVLPSNIVGWVSVSGIPFGTPMINWMMKRWLFRRVYRFAAWVRGASHLAVEDLAFTPLKIESLNRQEIPFPVYHIAGFPVGEHLSCRRARLWFRRFKNDGPTDSVLMLTDLLHVPGTVIPIWGADHYLKSGWDSNEMFEAIIRDIQLKRKTTNPIQRPLSIAEQA